MKPSTSKSNIYKYKIKFYKEKLPYKEFKIYNKVMHEKLGIGKSTLKKYEDLRSNDKCEIPASILIQLATYFKIQPEELFQHKIKPIKLGSLLPNKEKQNGN